METNRKSREWIEGYDAAKEYFEHIVKGGSKLGSAPYRIFVEVVASSIRDKEKIGDKRTLALDCILKWSDTEFNRGVRQFLLEQINECNALACIDEVIEREGKGVTPEHVRKVFKELDEKIGRRLEG